MTTKIKELLTGESGTIIGYEPTCNKSFRKRLLAMGFTPGTLFEIIRVAPLGDPIEVRIRGSSISIRKDEASILLVKKVCQSRPCSIKCNCVTIVNA